MTINPLGIHPDETILANMSRPDRCETCRWWLSLKTVGGDDEWGQCRRHAPRAVIGTEDAFGDDDTAIQERKAFWPGTFNLDFCGEWAAKP